MSKTQGWIIIGLIALAIILALVGSNQPVPLGGDTNFDSIDTSDGYKVDGTTVIDGDGNLSITGTATLTTATTTITGANLLSNSTSTGFIIRADDGNCYRMTLDAAVAYTTSTASCL